MKIIYVTDQFLPSTSADTEQFVNMVAALGKLAEVTLLSGKYRFKDAPTLAELEDYYQIDGKFRMEFLQQALPAIRGVEKVGIALKATSKYKKLDADVIYTRNIPVIIATLLFTKKPVIYETYRPWPDRNLQARWFFKKIARQQRFLGIILHSGFAKKAFRKVGFDEDKLTVEHNAFRNDFFSDRDKSITQLRSKLKLPQDKIVVTYTGRVTAEKGLHQLLRLSKKFPKVLFLIIGSEGRGEIEKEAEKCDNIIVITWQDKVSTTDYISASDILYIPTSLVARDKAKNTVLPIKTFMYKASGKAILAPDIEDIREVLSHNKTAILVKPDDRNAAIEGLKKLLDDKNLRKEIGIAAKKEMQDLTWNNRAKRILNFVQQRLDSI